MPGARQLPAGPQQQPRREYGHGAEQHALGAETPGQHRCQRREHAQKGHRHSGEHNHCPARQPGVGRYFGKHGRETREHRAQVQPDQHQAQAKVGQRAGAADPVGSAAGTSSISASTSMPGRLRRAWDGRAAVSSGPGRSSVSHRPILAGVPGRQRGRPGVIHLGGSQSRLPGSATIVWTGKLPVRVINRQMLGGTMSFPTCAESATAPASPDDQQGFGGGSASLVCSVLAIPSMVTGRASVFAALFTRPDTGTSGLDWVAPAVLFSLPVLFGLALPGPWHPRGRRIAQWHQGLESGSPASWSAFFIMAGPRHQHLMLLNRCRALHIMYPAGALPRRLPAIAMVPPGQLRWSPAMPGRRRAGSTILEGMSESPESPQHAAAPRPVTPGSQASFGTYGGRPVSFVRRGTRLQGRRQAAWEEHSDRWAVTFPAMSPTPRSTRTTRSTPRPSSAARPR